MAGRRGLWMIVLAALAGGCSIAPRDFFDLRNPAPLVRARASTLGSRLPESVAVPLLLDRLDDQDQVVRMTAHEELRRRTGQDFGYVPYGDPAERGRAVARWRTWWNGRRTPTLARRRQP